MPARRRPAHNNNHHEPRRSKCDRRRDHGHHGDDKGKKCGSHGKPWKPPIYNGGHGHCHD
jgi:hypothetical protein